MDSSGFKAKGTMRCISVQQLNFSQSFDDLHKLWFVLYKERNLLLTDKEKTRRAQRPVTGIEESRYLKVKRSMGAIKFVMNERKKIDSIVNPKIARPDPSSTMMDGI